jgi:hypothetical protein
LRVHWRAASSQSTVSGMLVSCDSRPTSDGIYI